MRLEVQAGGKTYVAQGSALGFSQKDPDCVQGKAAWSAGPVQGRTEFAFDYDGLAQFALEFGRAGVAIEAMQLVIPMRTQEAWLMHPVTDLLRFHYAGAIPSGKVLVVLTSYGPAGEAALELDSKLLGLSPECRAHNAETGEALERVGPGRFKLSLPRHDFRLVRIEPGG